MQRKIRQHMKRLWILPLLATALMGFGGELKSFDASFEQHIIDENDKRVVYRGHVWAQRPHSAHWRYSEPVEKEVYMNGNEVVVVEPEMEQAIVRQLREEIDFFTILSHAKPLGDGRYEAQYDSQTFTITADGELLVSISYRDTFDNRIELRFGEQHQNTPIPPSTFNAEIPDGYDVIY